MICYHRAVDVAQVQSVNWTIAQRTFRYFPQAGFGVDKAPSRTLGHQQR